MTYRVLFLVALIHSVLLTGASTVVAQGEDSEKSQRAVLVTGATSGIGRATAELLASEGFYVYAGARKQEDMDALNAIDNMEAVRLDVTEPDEIAAAVEQVRAGGRGLYGLINNAGVAVVAPMVEVSEEDLHFQLDVNVYGPYRVTKAFMPMLLESQGRVYTTGSISGVIVWGLGGPYTMSKHAVEAMTDALAMEMEPFGVEVGVVQPGNYNSKISESRRQRLIESGYSAEGSLFADRMEQMLEAPGDRSRHKEPDEVAQAFLHAMTAEEPKLRYMVVPDENEARMTIGAVIRRLVQMNQDQPYEFSREELIGMLDQAIADQSED